jgi:hypothetical protein
MDKTTKNLLTKLQDAISEQLMGVFAMVLKERQEFYLNNPNIKIGVAEIEKIISQYGNTNGAISGGLSLIPGLAGLATVVPEIALIVRNQLQMVYDIAVAHKKQNIVNKELLAGVLLSYFGAKGIEMLTVQGSKVLLQQSSIVFFEQIVGMLSVQLSQQLIQSALMKWIPLAGGIAMGMWSRYSTMKIGKHAELIFGKTIETIPEKASLDKKEAAQAEAALPAQTDLDLAKIRVLINLMHIDLNNDSREAKFVEALIQHSGLDVDVQLELAQQLHHKEQVSVDVSIFKKAPAAATGLLVDMLALAKSDTETPLAEMLYLKKTAQQIGVTAAELEQILAV